MQQNSSLGLMVIILRPPSCLNLNFDLLESMKATRTVDEYEIM